MASGRPYSSRVGMSIKWLVPLGQTRALTMALHSVAEATRGTHGCVSCSVTTDIGNRGEVHYTEEWLTEDDLRERLRSDTFDSPVHADGRRHAGATHRVHARARNAGLRFRRGGPGIRPVIMARGSAFRRHSMQWQSRATRAMALAMSACVVVQSSLRRCWARSRQRRRKPPPPRRRPPWRRRSTAAGLATTRRRAAGRSACSSRRSRAGTDRVTWWRTPPCRSPRRAPPSRRSGTVKLEADTSVAVERTARQLQPGQAHRNDTFPTCRTISFAR